VVRIAIVDDHPAVLAGLRGFIAGAGGLEVVLGVDSGERLLRDVEATRPDVVVDDDDLSRGDGLTLCRRLKERARAPGVVLYSAYAGPALAVSAWIAGADALVDKRAAASELIDTVRLVAAGERVLPAVPPDLREAAMARLREVDVPVASMRLAGTSEQDIADTLGVDRRDVAGTVQRVVRTLRPAGSRSLAP
jgi:DNA-binding NarL/FixJ family response regulator